VTIAPARDTWRPSLGAWPDGPVTHFRVWAPLTRQVELVIERPDTPADSHVMDAGPAGFFTAALEDAPPGTRYRYRLDGRGPHPDPASRFQPEGVHGASLVVDPRDFVWSDRGWTGCPLDALAIYELHVGTFTPAGTFAGVEARLPYLRDLGVTGVELMPVADFPGARNWGYDGAALFAPARCYGTPGDLRRLVDAAHRLGLALLLDVVYNHVGPDGAWLQAFSPYYFSERHTSPWGAAMNLDGEHAGVVRDFFIENALHWIHEYHVDGLRLDATHAMRDGSPRHFVAELAARVRAETPQRPVLLVAEDHRNLTEIVRPARDGGWDMDAVWADDLHHELRRLLAGDSDGYYADHDGTAASVAATIRQGWSFTGQHSAYLGESRGTDPAGVPMERFVVCLQNHDQIGNRAFGDRLHHQIDLASFRSASVLLLTAPETPLIFMGQEWAAGTPFCYFTDHAGELGRLVTEGRRREFERFAAFADPAARYRIPDPQAEGTFLGSRLDWRELDREPHAGIRRLYAALLRLRRDESGLRAGGRGGLQTSAPDGDTVVVRRSTASGAVYVVARLRGAGSVTLDPVDPSMSGRSTQWTCLLDSEDPRFTTDAMPPMSDLSGPAPAIRFARPSAVVLKALWPTVAASGLWR
jgi:maltooligosyltrehalose trehalohydrolase